MATLNKNFRIKNGLVVEGTTATVNGQNVLTETGSDQYILNLIGGETLVKSVDPADFKVTVSGELQIDSLSTLARTTDITNAIDDLTTDQIEEGTSPGRLYFTDTRAQDAVGATNGLSKQDQGTSIGIDRTTVDTWYDAAGAASAAQTAANTYTDNAVNGLDTDDIEEGTSNVYYTDSRARGALSSGTGISYDSGTGVISVDNTVATQSYVDTAVNNLIDGAPGLLDTLNEIAAAINDDANYFTTVTNAINAKQNALTAGANIDITNDTISVTGLDTDDVAEGQNLYFTDERAIDAVSDADIYPNAVVIDNVAKQIAAELTGVQASSVVTGHMSSDYKSGKYIVSISNGSHRQVSEILYTIDYANNIDQTEYAIVTTNGTLANISIEYKSSTGAVNLWVHPLNGYTVDLRAMGTWIK